MDAAKPPLELIPQKPMAIAPALRIPGSSESSHPLPSETPNLSATEATIATILASAPATPSESESFGCLGLLSQNL